MLDLSGLDLEEIATALADLTDYEHRWLISPETGEVVFWTSDTGIDGRAPVELEELDLICIVPHKRATSPARGGRALDRSRAGGQDAAELAARVDAELGEDLVQVVLDGARADEQLGPDLGVRQAVAGQPGDLGFLSSQFFIPGGGSALGAVSPAARSSRLARSANAAAPIASSMPCAVCSCVAAAALRAQPLPVQQMGARARGSSGRRRYGTVRPLPGRCRSVLASRRHVRGEE